MDMRRSGPESSSSGEGHDTVQHASEAGPSTERSTNVDTISPPPEGSLASTVPQQPSTLPSVPSQIHIQLQHDPTSPPPPPQHSPTTAIPQTEAADPNISTLTAPSPSTSIAMMRGSESAVRPPIPLEPPTNTTLAELSRNGGETLRLMENPSFWENEASSQNLAAMRERVEMTAQLNGSMLEYARVSRSATTNHERVMLVIQRDRPVPIVASGSGNAVAYQLTIGRQGTVGSFPAVHTGTSGPETTVLSPRSSQRPGRVPADDDDGVTLRGLRVREMMMEHQASSGSSRQTEPRQHLPTTERLQVVLNSDGSVAPLQSRQLPPPLAGTDSGTIPLIHYPPGDLPSPSATPPTVVRVSSPTTIESPHRADSISPRPPYLPSTIIENTSSPASPSAYPLSLPHIRHVFDPSTATTPPSAIPEPHNPLPPNVLPMPLRLPLQREIRQPSEYHPPPDQPLPLRRRLDDSGRSVGVGRYSPSPLFNPGTVQEYILDPTAAQTAAPRLQPRSSAPMPEFDLPTLRAFYPVYPPRQETAGFVPPGITDSALQTPRPFSASHTRWPRSFRREDANGDEIMSDDEETAAEERQREVRNSSRLTSQSTTDLTLPFAVSIPDGRMDDEPRPGDDQEKHGSDDSGEMTISGNRAGSAGSSRPGSRGSSRGFDLNSIRTGGGTARIRPYPLPIHPSEMLRKPSLAARDWRTRFTPIPPLQGSVAAARAAAQAKGSRRVSRRYATDPVGR